MNEDDHRAGTTWHGYALTRTESDSTPTDLTGAVARMTWKNSSNAEVMDWTLGNGLALDNDPTTGILYIQGPGVIDEDPGLLNYDLKVWLATGEVVVEICGTMRIIEGVTEGLPE
jgi:hypothetical protein